MDNTGQPTGSLPLGLMPDSPYANNDEILKKFAALEEEQFDKIMDRLINHRDIPKEKAEEARDEFRKFMALIHLTDHSVAPTKGADRFWHEFLMHTKDYTNFCQKHFGRFIHHNPSETGADESKRESEQLITRTFGRMASMVVKCQNGCNTCSADWRSLNSSTRIRES